MRRLFLSVILSFFSLAGFAALGATPASAQVGWQITQRALPTHLEPGHHGLIELDVYNTSAENSSGPVTVTDTLPAGVYAESAGYYGYLEGSQERVDETNLEQPTVESGAGAWQCSGLGPPSPPSVAVVTCTNTNNMPTIGAGAEQQLIIGVHVRQEVEGVEARTEVNAATVSGGGASASASTSDSLAVEPTPAGFGLAGTGGWFTNADGTLDTQAGSHPYDLTYSFDLNSIREPNPSPAETDPTQAGDPLRRTDLNLPPGIVGNPTAVPRCAQQQFDGGFAFSECPVSTQVGVDTIGLGFSREHVQETEVPVYNMVPPPGVPAQFAFYLLGNKTYIDSDVRSGSDYGISSDVNDIAQSVHLIFDSITIWGDPGEPSHNAQRRGTGEGCSNRSVNLAHGCAAGAPAVPFLTLPASCEGPQTFTNTFSSWEEPNNVARGSFQIPANTGCESFGFGPSLTAAPDTLAADTPAGLTVDIKPPVDGSVEGTSDIRNTTVTTPPGIVINPGQAAGLQSCPAGRPSFEPGSERYGDALTTEAEKNNGEEDSGPPNCPNASKVGTIEFETPLLFKPLKGDVYVLQSDPPHLQLLLAFSGEGVNAKVIGDAELCESAGEVIHEKTCEAPGQIITTVVTGYPQYPNIPEFPFSDFKLSFSGGAQAALDTPTQCGSYTTTSDFTPWSTPFTAEASPFSKFAIDSGPGDSACSSNPLPFSPELIAGATDPKGGSFTNFSLLLQRGDGQQRIERLSFVAPPGLGGLLATVPLCGEPQAAEGTCSSASQIGHAAVASGPGPYPLVIPQPGDPESKIYLTGPYDGAPFGLSIATPVIAGPFVLNNGLPIVTRGRVEINPTTAQIVVTTNELPQLVNGVPTDLRLVNSVIERPGFMFNPTHCAPASFSGTASGTPPPGVAGAKATAPIATSFDLVGCKGLEFSPTFTASTSGKTSKDDGASLVLKVQRQSGPASDQANFAEAKIELPEQLPSRLTTLQRACLAKTFEQNPASCPSESDIGYVKVVTPELPVPLEGPAYFVSHGGEAFPSVEFVLQGDGVTIVVTATTYISKAGITSSTIHAVPDAPFTSFELVFPEKPFSALGTNKNLCALTKTVTTKKTVRERVNEKVHGKTVTVTKKVTKKTTKTEPESLKMPTEFIAQNGIQIHQVTPVTVTGCPKVLKKAKGKPKKKAKAHKKK